MPEEVSTVNINVNVSEAVIRGVRPKIASLCLAFKLIAIPVFDFAQDSTRSQSPPVYWYWYQVFFFQAESSRVFHRGQSRNQVVSVVQALLPSR